jgi:hypothetical protein
MKKCECTLALAAPVPILQYRKESLNFKSKNING